MEINGLEESDIASLMSPAIQIYDAEAFHGFQRMQVDGSKITGTARREDWWNN